MTKFSVTTSWFGCWVKDNGSVVETICRVGSDHPSVAASLLGVSDEREAVDQAISNGWVRIGVHDREIVVSAEEPTLEAVDAAINFILDQKLKVAYWLSGATRAMHCPTELCDALREIARAPAPELC